MTASTGWHLAIGFASLIGLPTDGLAQTSHSPTEDRVPAPAAPALIYLANEGIMLRGSGGQVFIDAFFGDGLPDYPAVPQPLRDSLEQALTGFGGPALVLTTHAHRDHFDAGALARYLESNPAARALGPPDSGKGPVPLDLGWVRVRPVALPHGHTMRPVGHTAWLVMLDGITALHIGDSDSDPASWPALGLPATGVDLALVPFWYAMDERRFTALLEVTRARAIILLHAPLGPQGDRLRQFGGWEAWSRTLHQRYPQVRTPSRPGEEVGDLFS